MSDRSDQRSHTPPHAAIGPWTAYSLSACAVTLSAFALGVEWLGETTLGLPVGVWGIGAGYGVLALSRGLGHSFAAPKLRLPNFSGAATSAGEYFGRLRRAGGDRPRASDNASRPAGERRSGAVVIRIGLDLPIEDRQFVLDAASRFGPYEGVRFEWVTLSSVEEAERGPRERSRRWSDRHRACDATIRRVESSGGRSKPTLEITTSQHGAAAGWKDWGRPEEFNYAGCFPTRLDPAMVTLGSTRIDHDTAPALARLAAAAAAFRRTAVFGASGGVGINASPAERAADDLILEAFRWAADTRGNASSSPIRRVCARVGAAWAVGRGLGVTPIERVRLVESAASHLTREPQLILQSLASAVAAGAAGGSGADDASRTPDDAMIDAVERLIQLDERASVDPFPFVMSELEHGLGDSLTLGRIAAGAAMLWSGARGSSMKFLREDLLADIEHTGWLRQRPPMRTLLTRLVREADKARNEWDSKQSSRRAA